NQTHAGGDPYQRRATHLHRTNRVRHRLRAFEIARDFGVGKRALVDDPYTRARRPCDGLDGHEAEPNAEWGMRNAESPGGYRTIPYISHSEFRIPHCGVRIPPCPTKLSCSTSATASRLSRSIVPTSSMRSMIKSCWSWVRSP